MRFLAETKSSKFPKAKNNGERLVKGGKRMESQSVIFFLRMPVLLSPLPSTRNRKQRCS